MTQIAFENLDSVKILIDFEIIVQRFQYQSPEIGSVVRRILNFSQK